MLVSTGLSRIPRNSTLKSCFRWILTNQHYHHQSHVYSNLQSHSDCTHKVLGCSKVCLWEFPAFISFRHHCHHGSSPVVEEQLDPFSLVADEVSIIADRLHATVVTKDPKLALGAAYFFKKGVEGKRVCSTILLLMATAVHKNMPESSMTGTGDSSTTKLRLKQQCIAAVTEMIHVASLVHDDVLDDAVTRRGIASLNNIMGNKMAILVGDFLLFRAFTALSSVKNTKVVSLLATAISNLVTGELMQMSSISEERCSMEYYMEKSYNKTAALLSNSCQAIAVLSDQTADTAMLAHEYGKNLGMAYQVIDDVLDFTGTSTTLGKESLFDLRHGIVTAPILFAMEEFPQLRAVVDGGFENQTDVDLALEYLAKSQGIQKSRELAAKHANLAAAAIGSLPESLDEDVLRSRRALVELTQIILKRKK